jgi:pimeloyl-ACP methyl ester carboxylesterase
MTVYAHLHRAELRLALAAPAPAQGWISRWTTVAGVPTHHRQREDEAPQALPVVLVHGLAVSHRYLMPTAHALAGRHPVLVPDLPGFGLSGKPAMAYDVRRHAAHLAAWLGLRGLGRVCVLGHSFGAEVAAALAADRPGLVAALVLAGPTSDPAARTRRAQIARWCTDLLVEDPRQAAILARDVRDARPWRVFATLSHSVRNAIEEDLARAGAPTLVICGSRDPVAPPAWRAAAARTAGGSVVRVPGAAHNAATTAGRQVADAVAAFLAGPAVLAGPAEREAGPADRGPFSAAPRSGRPAGG